MLSVDSERASCGLAARNLGVGKSTTGYRMLSELASAGVTAAFVDADQVRHAAGTTTSETELIATALPDLSQRFCAFGAQLLVVAGLADDADHLRRLLPALPRERVLAVHLDADGDTIRERVHRRGWLVELAEDAVEYAAQINADLADLHVNTKDRTPAGLAAQVAPAAQAHLARTAAESCGAEPHDRGAFAPRRVVAITGPGGVGVSTTGFETFFQLARAGGPVGYVDAHQLGFLGADIRGDQLASLRADNARAVADTTELDPAAVAEAIMRQST